MTRKWIVLIGPPAGGKSTLSIQLKNHFNANYYSFDQEFPLEILKNSILDSKKHRNVFLDKIKMDESEWIVIDDTCHLRSMQKRYLHASEEVKGIKIVFLYISAKNDEISELQERNGRRESIVRSEEIENITRHLNSNKMQWTNLLEYNFKELPSFNNIITDIYGIIDVYKPRNLDQIRLKDTKSDSNFFNRLNLVLNKKIASAFKKRFDNLDGKEVALAKKKYLDDLKGYYDGNGNDEDEEDVQYLVTDFCNKYLHQ